MFYFLIENTVISYLRSPNIPRVHITPIHTTIREINVARKDLKNKKKNFDCTNITDFMKKMTNMPVHLLKIVIIYEFHQMSTEAQMALRRIMELNSNRVRFVFVTQEYGQIIQALQSRCTILKLQKLDQDEMSNILQTICQKENIVVSQELYDLIYLNTDGDIKAAVNLLQILGKTDLESIYNILGVPETEVIQQIILNCDQGNTQLAYKKVRSLLEGGFDISDLLDLLTRVLVKSNSFPNKNEFLRSLCHDTFTIQECYTETQFYNLINHLGEIGSKN